MVKLTIDNQPIEVKAGTTVLEAAEKLGIYIPTLCHHESLLPYGGCRLCVVELCRKGTADLTSSCTYKVEEGLIVKTSTERVERVRRLEDKAIPQGFDYDNITSFRKEAREKLKRFQPATLGQASRISGVTPADIAILLVHLEKAKCAK